MDEIKQIEEANFASWPSQYTKTDGGWVLRVSPDLPFKRANSLNFLDVTDEDQLEIRLENAVAYFQSHGLKSILRATPLTPPAVLLHPNWGEQYDQTLVMTKKLSGQKIEVSGQDIQSCDRPKTVWLDAYTKLMIPDGISSKALQDTLFKIADLPRFFTVSHNNRVVGVGVGAIYENRVGLFGLGIDPNYQRLGFATALSQAVLGWGVKNGAQTAWLQVEESNLAASSLYSKLGFETKYSYSYLNWNP